MRNRRTIVALACTALAATSAVVAAPAEAARRGDLTLAKTGTPGTVYLSGAPLSGSVLYHLTVANAGAKRSVPMTDITITDTIPAGTAYRDDLSSVECDGAAAGPVTCSIPGPLAWRATATVEVVLDIGGSLAGTAITNAATASSPLESPALEGANNSASATTQVVFDPTQAAGFFAAGSTASADARNGNANAYKVSVPASSNGVVFHLSAEDPTPICGADCLYEDAVFVVPDTSLAGHQITDPNQPVVLDLTMGPRSPCRGIGGDDPCFNIRYIKPGQPGRIVPFCTGAGPGANEGPGIAEPSPCKNHQFKTAEGKINFQILMLWDDPGFY